VNYETCQNENMKPASGRLPTLGVALTRFKYHLRTFGLSETLGRAARKVKRIALARVGLKRRAVTPAAAAPEVLGLRPGEWVEVKSEAEIRRTLDANGKHRGLDFTEEMLGYCGGRFRVFKRVQRICMEGEGAEMRVLQNTVSLDGVICNGGSRACDRACLLFWREAWLRRVESEEPDITAEAA
jgi:hypothetical protein